MNTTESIHRYIENHGPVTQRQIETALAIGTVRARNCIVGLRRAGKIEAKGEKRESDVGREQVLWVCVVGKSSVEFVLRTALRTRTPLERAWHA